MELFSTNDKVLLIAQSYPTSLMEVNGLR